MKTSTLVELNEETTYEFWYSEKQVDMKNKLFNNLNYSRRDFLKGLPLGIGSMMLLGTLTKSIFSSRSNRNSAPPVVPKGSIFTPSKKRKI